MAQHISQNSNDKQEVAPALQALQETTGRLPEKLSADNGYWSGDNLQALKQNGTDAYIATDRGEKTHKIPLDSSDRKLVKADFDYHEADNTFTCPEGQVLTMKRESQDGSRVYQGSPVVCGDCPLQSRCCQSAKGEARTITTDDKEPLRQQMASKMATEPATKWFMVSAKRLLSRCLVKSKIADFVVSVCEVKKKSPVNFQWSVLRTI